MSTNKLPDQISYYKDFNDEIHNFYRASKTPFVYLPKIAGRVINIQNFFNAVVIRGGYKKVCDNQEWSAVAKDLNLPSSCGNLSISLRRFYYKSLASFERHKYPNLSVKYSNFILGDNPELLQSSNRYPSNNLENSLGIGFSQRFETLTNNSLVFPSNLLESTDSGRFYKNDSYYYRSILPEIQDKCILPPWDLSRHQPGSDDTLSGPLRIKETYDLQNIELSLASGLPNEIDVALNMLLVKSASSYNMISLRRNENLLRLLLATVGLIDDDLNSFDLCQKDWNETSRLDFLQFWLLRSNATGRKFLEESLFPEYFSKKKISSNKEDAYFNEFSPTIINAKSAEMSRVLHVATIILNIITQPPQSQSNIPSSVNHNGNTIFIPDVDDDLAYQSAALSSPSHKSKSLYPITRNSSISQLLNASPPLSLWRDNARFVSSSPMAISFIFLCCYSNESYIRNLGYQLISSNIKFDLIPRASDYSVELLRKLSYDSDDLFKNTQSKNMINKILANESSQSEFPLLPTISECTIDFILNSLCRTDQENANSKVPHDDKCSLQNEDRNTVISAVNLLTNLFRVTENKNSQILLTLLPSKIWEKLVNLLVLPDLGIVYCVLESLLAMTSSGYSGCFILTTSTKTSHLFQTLLALLNIEGQALGQKSLHRIKLLPRNLPQSYSQYLLNNQYQTAFLRNNLSSMKNYRIKCQAVEKVIDYCPNNNPSYLVGLLSCSNDKDNHSFKPTTSDSINETNSKVKSQIFENNLEDDQDNQEDETGSHTNEDEDGRDSKSKRKEMELELGDKKEEDSLMRSPIERVLANVTPHPTSLSELSDRLQMPPPPLPPPSALKRAATKEKTQTHEGKLFKGDDDNYSLINPMLINGSGDHSNRLINKSPSISNPIHNGLKKFNFSKMKNGLKNGKINSNGKIEETGTKKILMSKQEDISVLSENWIDPGSNSGDHDDNQYSSNLDEIDIQSSSPQSLDENYLEEISKRVDILDEMDCETDGNKIIFFCEWDDCLLKFKSPDILSKHIYEIHFKKSLETNSKCRLNCLWTDCPSQSIPRAKFSLLSHLNEFHCNLTQLTERSESIRKHLFDTSKKSSIEALSNNNHAGSFDSYNDQSGLSIIRNVELRRMENEININILGSGKPLLLNGKFINSQPNTSSIPPREGPVTKHLRVTAALILKNLTVAVPETRKYITMREDSLAEISFGSSPNVANSNGSSSSSSSMMVRTNDSNRIVAQFLYPQSKT